MSWGIGEWGISPWGGALPTAAGDNPPIIVLRSPAANAVDVLENATISISFADFDLDLDIGTTLIEIDGVPVFTGLGGFAAGYVGSTSFSVGRFTVQFMKLGGWGFDTLVTVRAFIEDLTGKCADDTWSWRTRINPICYSGLNPLAVELFVQSPMTRFLDLEPVRQVFLNNALQAQTQAIANSENKAARVLYQEAFATEIHTITNSFGIRNEPALRSVVCERQRVAEIDVQLQRHIKRIKAGVESLFLLGALPKEYKAEFSDYLDSTTYNYRVSLVANVLILARLTETAS